jgi:hypothetical protein
MEGVDLVGGARNAVLTKEHGPLDLVRSSLVGLDRVPESDKPRRHRLEDLVASKRRPVATTRDHWPHLAEEGYGFGHSCSTSAGPGHLADYRWVTAGRGAELSEDAREMGTAGWGVKTDGHQAHQMVDP